MAIEGGGSQTESEQPARGQDVDGVIDVEVESQVELSNLIKFVRSKLEGKIPIEQAQVALEIAAEITSLEEVVADELALSIDESETQRVVATRIIMANINPNIKALRTQAALQLSPDQQSIINEVLSIFRHQIQTLMGKFKAQADELGREEMDSGVAHEVGIPAQQEPVNQVRELHEISDLDSALMAVEARLEDSSFNPLEIHEEYNHKNAFQHLSDLRQALEVILPALAEQNAVHARRLIARLDALMPKLEERRVFFARTRLREQYETHEFKSELDTLLNQDFESLTVDHKFEIFNKLSQVTKDICADLKYDELTAELQKIVDDLFLSQAQAAIKSLSKVLERNAFRDSALEVSRPNLGRLWDLVTSDQLISGASHERHPIRGEIEDILISLARDRAFPSIALDDPELIESLMSADIQFDPEVQRYVDYAIDRIFDPVNQLNERLFDLQTRYQQIKDGVPNVEPVTAKQVAKLREDFDYYRSVFKSRRFRAAVRSCSPTKFDTMQRVASELDISDTFVDIVKIQELKTMSYENLAKHCLAVGVDPFAFRTARSGTQQEYYAEVVRVVKERLFGPNPEDTPWADHQRKRWFNFLAMSILDNKGQYEAEVAATTKSAEVAGDKLSLESALSEHLITRDELIEVTTLDPEYGDYFEAMIDGLKVQAALKGPLKAQDRPADLPTPEQARQRLQAMSPSELKIHNPMMTTMGQVAYYRGKMYQYNPAFDYVALTNESSGRSAMREYFTNHVDVPANLNTPEKNETRKFVIDFACRIYTGLTVLDESLFTLQASTQTRGHNGSEKNYGNLYLAIATAIHAVFRYASPKHPSIITHFPFTENSRPDFYFLNSQIEHDFIHSLTMARKRQHCFSDTSLYFEKVDYPGFLEMIYPESSSLFTLIGSEQLWVVHEDCVGIEKPESVTSPDGTATTRQTRGRYTHKLIDGTGKVIAFRNANSEVFYADGQKMGRLELAYESASVDEIQARRSAGEGGTGDNARMRGYFAYNDNPRNDVMANTKVVVGEAIFQNPGEGSRKRITDSVQSRTLYYTALRGMEQIFDIVFSSVPGGLTAAQIAEGRGTGTSLIGELMSKLGMLKMFPNFAIDKLVAPYLTYYCHRLIQSFSQRSPSERTRLVVMIAEQITQTGAYGGLARQEAQIEQVLNTLLTIEKPDSRLDTSVWKKAQATLWKGTSKQKTVWIYARPEIEYYVDNREEERRDYLTSWWEEEHPGEPVPPIGGGMATIRRIIHRQIEKITGDTYPREVLEIIEAQRKGTNIVPYLDFKNTQLKAGQRDEPRQ